MHRILRDQFVYAFTPEMTPVLEIEPGERAVVEAYDASTGRIRTPEDFIRYRQIRDRTRVNPAGGPIFVRGAAPGDELVVTIERIDLADQGYIRAAPGGPVLPDVEGPRAIIVKVEDGYLDYPTGIRLPARPMVGVIGTAPQSGAILTADPRPQGSNLDCNAIRVGSRVHLPVHVAGGLLAIGDVHASMGDGEVSEGGVEIAAEVQVQVELTRGASYGWAWVETADDVVAVGNAPRVDGAISVAVDRKTHLLGSRHGLSRTDAFIMVSARGDVHVGQCCGGLDATAYVVFPRL